MKLIPVPGFGAGVLDSKEGNLAAYIDRAVLGGHVWNQAKVYDPEGILSTVPAIVTALAGVLTGHFLRTRREPFEKVSAMFVAGVACVVAGWAWNFWFPVNKALWTSSYVFLTAGFALQTLALCYWLIDIKGYRAWAKPFLVFGSNALAVYFFSEAFVRVVDYRSFKTAGGEETNLLALVYERVFAPLASPLNASLMFAVCTVLFWLCLMWILYRRRVFIKV